MDLATATFTMGHLTLTTSATKSPIRVMQVTIFWREINTIFWRHIGIRIIQDGKGFTQLGHNQVSCFYFLGGNNLLSSRRQISPTVATRLACISLRFCQALGMPLIASHFASSITFVCPRNMNKRIADIFIATWYGKNSQNNTPGMFFMKVHTRFRCPL